MIVEIKAARRVTDLIQEVLKDKVKVLEDSLITDVGDSIKLASDVTCIHELKSICKMFDQTSEE